MKPAPIFILALTLLAHAGTASAQAPDSAPPATEAERLFREGVADLEAGNTAAACEKLSKSLELVTRASTLLNLALCEAEQGKLASALARYRQGVALLPSGDPRLESAARSMEDIAKRVPRLTIELAPSTPPDARVLVDKMEIERNELERIPLDRGEHTVTLAVPGHRDATKRVTLKEGEPATLKIAPGPRLRAASEGPERAPAKPDDDSLRIAGFVVGSIGVLGAVGAAVTGGMLLSNDETIESECPNQQCTSVGLDTIDQSEGLIIGNYVSWGVAIAGLGTGAALLIADAILDDDGTVSTGISVAPDGGFGSVTVRF
jgi:hypothetical protein